MEEQYSVKRRLDENLQILKDKLGYKTTFDLIVRTIQAAHKKGALIFLDGFVNDYAVIEIMKSLMRIPRGGLTVNALEHLLHDYLPFYEISTADDLQDAMVQVLSGTMLLLIDGVCTVFVLDVRQYPVRGIEEPDLERVTRGSREGFVETALFNVNLIRRRIRDPMLRFEALQVGRRSRTDVLVGYIADIADPSLIQEVKKRIERIDRDAIPMGGKTWRVHSRYQY